MVYGSNIERVKRSCELIRRLSGRVNERQGVTEMKRKSRTMPYFLTLVNCDASHVLFARVCVSDGVE